MAKDCNRSPSQQLESGPDSPELQLIYRTAPIGLAFLSTDCRYLMINKHLTEICGISIAEHIGRSVRETVPQVADQVEHLVQTIVRTGEPITGIEINGQRPDGSNLDRVWITYWHPLMDRRGEVVGINVAAEEITERKRAEARLAASQERLLKLNETLAERVEAQAQERDRIWKLSQDLMVVSDLNGRILNINPAWQESLGWSPDELIAQSGESLIHPADRERSRRELANLIAGAKTQNLENRLLCKDGSYRWVSWIAVSEHGVIYASGRDVTKLRQTQEELEALRRRIADASRHTTGGAMTASIAHEINQPLAAIGMNANAGLRMLNGSASNLAEVRAALDQIVHDVNRISGVIGSVRAIFRSKQFSDRESVDLGELVGEVVALVRGDLEACRVSLHNQISDQPPKVIAERVPVQQVLLNLITNAIEAMSAVTGRERRLTIASEVDPPASVTITVADTGSGIDRAHLPRIFDPFFTTKSQGMGLGLAISRSIIEAHGGTLLASQRDPYGAVFRLTLPADGYGSP